MIDAKFEGSPAPDCRRLKYPPCQKCGDKLTGHEDDSETHCRWCVTGWDPETPIGVTAVNPKGQHASL